MMRTCDRIYVAAALIIAAIGLYVAAPVRAQEGTQIVWPNPGWVPYHQGLMTTRVTTIYGPNPLASGCSWAPAPMSTQSGGALSQQTSAPNSCLDANSASAVAAIWGPYPSAFQNGTPSPSQLGPTPGAACSGCGWGNGLGNIDVFFGGNAQYEPILTAGGTKSGGYPVYVSTAADPLYCVPQGIEQYNVPSRFLLVHIPANALPELDADHHMAIDDTAFKIHVVMEKAGVARTTTGLGGCGGLANPSPNPIGTLYGNSYIPWIGFPQGVAPNPSIPPVVPVPTPTPPYGTPPPDNSAGATDALQPGVAASTPLAGSTPQTTSAINGQGFGSWGIAGGISIEWVDQPRDFLTSPYYPQHAAILYGTCDTFTGSSYSSYGTGSYVYPTINNRSGTPTDNNDFCYDNSKAIIYGGHLWLDEAPTGARGSDGCDYVTWGLMEQLYVYGGYKDTIGPPVYCSYSGSPKNYGCSEDQIRFAIASDIEDTFSGNTWNYTCPNGSGGFIQCVDATPAPGASTSPSPWYYLLSSTGDSHNVYNVTHSTTSGCPGLIPAYTPLHCGDIITAPTVGTTSTPAAISAAAAGDRNIYYLPGQSRWVGSTYQEDNVIDGDYGIACGVQLAKHLHILRAPPTTY